MKPHRAGLALAALAACASSSCMDARVKVPVRVALHNKEQVVRPVPNLALAIYRRRADTSAPAGAAPAPVRCERDPSNTWGSADEPIRLRSGLDGTASVTLLPGDYELCTEAGAFAEKEVRWRVPFRVGDGVWELPSAGSAPDAWEYREGREQQPELILTNYNARWAEAASTSSAAPQQQSAPGTAEPPAAQPARP